MVRDERDRLAGSGRKQIEARLAERSGSWLASFAELVATAAGSGLPVRRLETYVAGLLGPDADGEVHERQTREALIDALVGRSAAISCGRASALPATLLAPTPAELRAAIRRVDGHADVWWLFAHQPLFAGCVQALARPFEGIGVTHVAGVEARGFVLAAPRRWPSAPASSPCTEPPDLLQARC